MDKKQVVYLDYAATTPVDPRVFKVMEPYFSEQFGNPSSIHQLGQRAEAVLDDSRDRVSAMFGCSPKEVVFTSCGSESDNLAIRGVALARKMQDNFNHILISPVEHHAVSRTVESLVEQYGFEAELLTVDDYGMVDPAEVQERIRPETALVSIIYANNEIGTINPIPEVGEICRQRNVPFHTDAVQAAAHLPVNVDALNVDLMSIGAHKFYGPKGVGALYVRRATPIMPVQTGGGQEFGLRAGTHNIPYIVGLVEAFDLTQSGRLQRNEHDILMRDGLIEYVLDTIPGSRLTGHPGQRLPNHASFVFHNVDGNTLLMMLDAAGFACSSGSACKTGDPEPSDVLLAMGLPREWALGSLRVTLGRSTSRSEIECLLQVLPKLVNECRRLVPQPLAATR